MSGRGRAEGAALPQSRPPKREAAKSARPKIAEFQKADAKKRRAEAAAKKKRKEDASKKRAIRESTATEARGGGGWA